MQRGTAFFILGGNCVLVVSVLLVSVIQKSLSGRFEPSYRSPATNYESYGLDSQYDNGVFDLGTWSCQLNMNTPFEYPNRHLSQQCMDETAALWIDVFLSVSVLVLAGLIWADWKGRRMLIRGYEDIAAGYEFYNG